MDLMGGRAPRNVLHPHGWCARARRAQLRASRAEHRRGTRFFITVPAFRLLWSKHDLYLGHFRRYRLKELASLCLGAGLELQEKFYFFATIFPAVFTLRALRAVSGGDGTRSDLRPAHPAVNALLKKLLLVESLWCRANRLLGVSAVVCAHSRMSRLSSGPAQ